MGALGLLATVVLGALAIYFGIITLSPKMKRKERERAGRPKVETLKGRVRFFVALAWAEVLLTPLALLIAFAIVVVEGGESEPKRFAIICSLVVLALAITKLASWMILVKLWIARVLSQPASSRRH